ncbi:MAG: HesA/MoeB/ThiF family protein, partial [Paracoccaceae bacterium]|nr:HesA/MoeB/ThiF family protein [Paracoccaceae bacterium]
MAGILGLMAAFWLGGQYLRVPVRLRWAMIGLLWAAVVAVQLLLPAGHPLREATGGRAETWLVLLGLVLLVAGYRAGLRRLRARVGKGPVAAPSGAFRPAELDRYARHIMLREIGGPGQRRLRDAGFRVVGAGGLGAPVLLYLAGAGVGCIGVIDDDVVDNSNLQRQVIHTDDRIGMAKVHSAALMMRALNPFIEVRPFQRRLDEGIAAQLFADYDLILDGSDNFDTRYLVNRVAARLGKPLISAAITQWEGQISLYDPGAGGPCYECVFPVRPAPGLVPSCAEAGVVAPLPGVIGALMALETVKHLTGAGEGLRGRLMIFDGLYGESRVIGV